MADGPGDGGPMNGDGGVQAGNAALLSDPVDVIIDKLLRSVHTHIHTHGRRRSQTEGAVTRGSRMLHVAALYISYGGMTGHG